MKFLLVVLFAFIAAVFAQTQTVEIGYKSSEIGISDGDTGYFTFVVTDEQYAWCGTGCTLEVIHDKTSGGEQEICLGDSMLSSCDNTEADYMASLGVEDIFETTYCLQISAAGTYYMSISGTCATSSGCLSSTDAEIKGVRLYEGSSTMDEFNCYANADYVPFYIDDDGGNTGFYDVSMSGVTNSSFEFPSMIVDLDAAEDLYLVLDIDEVDEVNYAVEFHITLDVACGTCEMCNDSYCSQYAEEGMSYVRYPSMQMDGDSAMEGSYSTGPISLTAGTWSVTPMVWETEFGTGTLNFRYCGGVGFECESAAGLIPSLTIMIALLAALFLYF